LKAMNTDRDKNAMDDFSSLTFREPWLLKKIFTSTASTWLAGKELLLQGGRDLRHEAKSTGIPKKTIMKKRKANKRVP
jgi:hypothetical protein